MGVCIKTHQTTRPLGRSRARVHLARCSTHARAPNEPHVRSQDHEDSLLGLRRSSEEMRSPRYYIARTDIFFFFTYPAESRGSRLWRRYTRTIRTKLSSFTYASARRVFTRQPGEIEFRDGSVWLLIRLMDCSSLRILSVLRTWNI